MIVSATVVAGELIYKIAMFSESDTALPVERVAFNRQVVCGDRP